MLTDPIKFCNYKHMSYTEKQRREAILELFLLFVCYVQHSHLPFILTKAILTAFCLQMCENKGFAGFPTLA